MRQTLCDKKNIFYCEMQAYTSDFYLSFYEIGRIGCFFCSITDLVFVSRLMF